MADLTEVAAGLYAEQPGAFVAARTVAVRAARAAGDRGLAAAVGALRRPSAAAAAVNLLVRERPEDVGRLLDLGVRLREAQAALAGADLRALHAEQQGTMADVAGAAVALLTAAGGAAGPAVRGQVEGTLRAAMGDAGAAAAVATGLLTRDLFSSGFEPVDVAGAVAVPDAPPLPGVPARRTPLRAVQDPPPVPEPEPAESAASGETGSGETAGGRRRRGRVITVDDPDPSAGPVRAVPAPGRRRGRVVTGDSNGDSTDASTGGRADAPAPRVDAARRGRGQQAAGHAERARPEQERAERARAEQERAEQERAEQERARRREAARRSADADVALARQDAAARAAARDAAEARVAAAENRAAELTALAEQTQQEVDRLRAVLADARQQAREVGLEARHARAARTAAARAADQAQARWREAQRHRDGL